jgi:C4-dicarboxylate-specific signal transduction histidine kinase
MSTTTAEAMTPPMRYQRALGAYIESDAGETGLMAAFELGRTMLAEEHSLLDLLTIHHAALASLLERSFDGADIEQRLVKANEFLAEVAAPFEMAHRGWREMADRLGRANEELERRVAERTGAHREAEERLNRAQHIAGIGSWEFDLETGRQIWSREMYRICGLPDRPHVPASVSVADYVHHDDRALHDAWFTQLRAGQDPGPIEYRIRRPDDECRVVAVEGEAICAPDGYVIKISCTLQDVTDGKAAEAHLRQLEAELAHVSRLNTIGHMASALAHEINQPLSAIANYLRGCIRLLNDKSDDVSRYLREALDSANEQALRAGQIVRRLRDFMTRHETEFRIESTRKLVEDAAALALLGARDAGVRVAVTLDPGVDLVLADRVQIQQVLANLLRNAMEAMQVSDRRELAISTAPAENDMVLVSVADSGPGISDEIAERLFQPFVTTKQQGMGVGLSICRTIIESHGGRIWLEPNSGEGAIFRFTLRQAALDE